MDVHEIKARWKDLYHVPEDDEGASLNRRGQQKSEFARRAVLSGAAVLLFVALLGMLLFYAWTVGTRALLIACAGAAAAGSRAAIPRRASSGASDDAASNARQTRAKTRVPLTQRVLTHKHNPGDRRHALRRERLLRAAGPAALQGDGRRRRQGVLRGARVTCHP